MVWVSVVIIIVDLDGVSWGVAGVTEVVDGGYFSGENA